jgi:hypothetical protein
MARHRTGLALLAVFLFGLAVSTRPLPAAPPAAKPSTPAAPQPGGERYEGFDLDLLARALAKLTTLRTQYGEAKGKEELERWLRGIGLSRRSYDLAYAAWWERFKADKTGKLEARFLTLNARYTNEANFSDTPDRSQEKRGGVTLDRYAEIAVAFSQPPIADVDFTLRVLQRFGIKSLAAWQKVNDAWLAAMREDTTFALTQQYAALYQKHAGPAFARAQESTLAKGLASRHDQETPRSGQTPKPPEIDEYLAGLQSNLPSERWRAARGYAHLCDLWAGPARKPAGDPRAPHCAPAALKSKLLPVMLDAIDHFEDATISDATGLLDFFGELELKTPEAKLAIQRARNRAGERLRTLEAAFTPIRDKAVPERITLRQKIDDYTGALRDFDRTLADW